MKSIVLAVVAATVVFQDLQAILARSRQPCLSLGEQLDALTRCFLCQPITPASTLEFENGLRLLLDECGRLVLQAVFNHIEPRSEERRVGKEGGFWWVLDF